MIDMHYDLLSIVYRDLLNNDLSFTKYWIKNYNNENVTGLIANLYFMSIAEMKQELHKKYYQSGKSVKDMFELSTNELKKLVNSDIKLVFGIEGCDYIKDEAELECLYELGLRSICLVWNEKNKYGSGVRYNGGLTELGKKFILKAIDLGIGIDLSHTNEETFYDIINVVKASKKVGYNPIVYASHSNSKQLCDRNRNLSDKQLYALKSVDGYVGIMSNRNFVVKNNSKLTPEELKINYLKHIDYIGHVIGFDHVMLSTDDMTFCENIDKEYGKLPIYDYKTIKKEIKKDLLKLYSLEITNDIIAGNANNLLGKFDNNKLKYKKRG